MTTFNLAIGIPSGESWPCLNGLSLSTLTLALMKHPVQGYDKTLISIFHEKSSILSASRHNIVKKALKAGCSHLLFVDSDQTYPAQTAHMLARHGKMVVGCNVAIKTIPSNSTARTKNPAWPGGDPVYTTPQSTGLQQVWRLGFGVMLINLEVFKRIPPPWFEILWDADIETYRGEDWQFCTMLEAANIPIYIDHDLSKDIGHVGHFTFRHDHVELPSKRDNESTIEEHRKCSGTR